MQFFKCFAFILASLIFFPSVVLADGSCQMYSKGHYSPDFEIKDSCKIAGSLKLDGDMLSGDFTVDTTKLKAGIRTEHLHGPDYLDSKKYSNVKLSLNPVKIGAKNFSGKITIKGKQKDVQGEVVESSKNKFVAKFAVNVLDFGIKQPKLGPAYIDEKITITASVSR